MRFSFEFVSLVFLVRAVLSWNFFLKYLNVL